MSRIATIFVTTFALSFAVTPYLASCGTLSTSVTPIATVVGDIAKGASACLAALDGVPENDLPSVAISVFQCISGVIAQFEPAATPDQVATMARNITIAHLRSVKELRALRSELAAPNPYAGSLLPPVGQLDSK